MKIELEKNERICLAHGIAVTGTFWYKDEAIPIILIKKKVHDALWKIALDDSKARNKSLHE